MPFIGRIQQSITLAATSLNKGCYTAHMNGKQQGLTLVELMITLAVAIALMSVGIPLFQSLTANNRAVTQTNAMVTALNLARSEAIKRATTVTVCPVSDATSATPQCIGSTNWANGWLVFVDGNTLGTVDGSGATADVRVRIWDAFSPAPNITTGASNVQFAADGTAASAADIEIDQEGSTGVDARCVRLLISGQVRSEKNACS